METTQVTSSLELIELKPGLRFTRYALETVIPDIETALFFGKVYELNAQQLGTLLAQLFRTPLVEALTSGAHSTELQDYLIDIVPSMEQGQVEYQPHVPHGEILPEMWAELEVEVAQSIKDVAAKLGTVVGKMKGKQGEMVFRTLATLNRRRPTIGDYRARIDHGLVQDNLVILDVSGSMSEPTIRAMVDDVVALSYKANAHLAIVSNTTTHWAPGTFDSASVLRAAEFGGTQYETLAPLFNQDWGTVITVADYDSGWAVKDHLADNCSSSIERLLDVSLVNRPTYLAECLGMFAKEIKPLLIAPTARVLGSHDRGYY